MPTKGIFDSTIQTLDKVLELRSQKHSAISANIANAETPGYSRLQVDFEEALKDAVGGSAATGRAATHPRHVPGPGGSLENLHAEIYRDESGSGIGDDNNVSLDREMVDLSDNQIRYEAAIRMLNKKFNMLKFVIQEKM